MSVCVGGDRFSGEGVAIMTGVQALVRLPLEQRRADERAGLDTAAFISGYPGSPLGGYDLELTRNAKLLAAHRIVHRPAVNEELAATAVMGSQRAHLLPQARHEGVAGYWYGKAPGLDRAGDAMRHGNYGGVARTGGALALVGDDPTAKSSTIPSASEATLAALKHQFAGRPPDTAEENIQSRCRGVLLMGISNKTGKMLLTTGNKSEMAVGYATLYGDMAGGFAPIKDCSKLLVYRLARWRNSKSAVIPPRVIDRPPSAELRHEQKDTDSLPPYEILDPILEAFIEDDLSVDQITARGFDRAVVGRILQMVKRNEYKRRQAPPGIRVSGRAFGRDWRYPITSGYKSP